MATKWYLLNGFLFLPQQVSSLNHPWLSSFFFHLSATRLKQLCSDPPHLILWTTISLQTPASSPTRNHACDSVFLRCQHVHAYTSFCSLCSEFLLQSRIFHLFLLSVKACLKCIWESFILVPLSFPMRINSSFNLALWTQCI